MSERFDVTEVTEGDTRLLVPEGSMINDIPPKEPAFFNPRARLNRDLSMAAYSAFLEEFEGPRTLLDAMTGVGARGIRAANELGIGVELNDAGQSALEFARRNASLNGIDGARFSSEEACRFLSAHSRKGSRGAIVDIDPFGSPAPYLDCCIRATMHGGIISATATDLQVLGGVFRDACRRRYGGAPLRAPYGNEVAIRLILGCARAVAARLGVTVSPLFAESDMHYYRTYFRILNRPDQQENLGYAAHCAACGSRELRHGRGMPCSACGGAALEGGPLWIGELFDAGFAGRMADAAGRLSVGRDCAKIAEKARSEAGMPGTYYTLDEVASRMGASPPRLDDAVHALREGGFAASVTSLNPTGFRTDAGIGQIMEVFGAIH